MDKFTCEFCNSVLRSESSLKAHINGSKKCLKNRGMKLVTNNVCIGCDLSFLTKNNLKIHCETCKKFSDVKYEQSIQERELLISNLRKEHEQSMQEKELLILNLKQEYDQELKEKELLISNLRKEYDQSMKEKELLILNLKQEKDHLNFVKEQLTISKIEYVQKIESLENRIDSLAKEAINRPTNNTVNHIRNNLSMTYTLEDIKEEELMDLFRENLTETVFMSGQKALAKLCTDKIINTRDFKKLICCTDISRRKFKYMDKKGNVNEDVEAREFVDKVTKPIKEAGKQVYDTMISSINDERDQAREDDYGKKEQLIDKSFQVMNRYKDIINIDDPKYNGDFTSELAILNKQ